MIEAAVIGIGGFGGVHVADLLRQAAHGRLHLAAAVARNPDRHADTVARLREAGCTIYSDPTEMFADRAGRLDLCTIPTSIPTHASLTVSALEAGANVLVEKPAAATLAEVNAMHAASKAAERFVAVGFQAIFAPETLRMKRALLDGVIGDLRSMSCKGLWPRPDSYYARDWVGALRLRDGRWVLDSPFNNAMAHQLNLMCFLAGSASKASAEPARIEAELFRAHKIETADTVALRVTTRSGLSLQFLGTHASEGSVDPVITIRGSKGTIVWSFTGIVIKREGQADQEVATLTGGELRDAVMGAVMGRISDPGRFVCGLDIAAVHTLCVNGAHLSAEVRDVPAEMVTREPAGGSVKTVIAGIDALIDQGYREEKLFSELGVPWAKPGRAIVLEDPTEIEKAYT